MKIIPNISIRFTKEDVSINSTSHNMCRIRECHQWSQTGTANKAANRNVYASKAKQGCLMPITKHSRHIIMYDYMLKSMQEKPENINAGPIY